MASFDSGFSIEIPSNVFFGAVIAGLVLFAVAAVTAFVVRIVRTWQPKHQLRAVDDLSQKMNLTVPEDLREPLAHAVAVRKRGAEVASLIGMACAGLALWLVLEPASDSTEEINLVAILIIAAVPGLFTTVGAVIGGLLARRETPGKARTARLTPLTYRDLITPIEQNLLVLTVACGIIFPAILLAASFAPWTDAKLVGIANAPVFLGAGLAVGVLWLALPRISRRLVSTRALAGDEHALAWSDALAARIVRDLTYFAITASSMTAIIATGALGFIVPREWAEAGAAFPTIALMIGFGVLITGVMIVDRREPEKHIQRTLWPQFAADGR